MRVNGGIVFSKQADILPQRTPPLRGVLKYLYIFCRIISKQVPS